MPRTLRNTVMALLLLLTCGSVPLLAVTVSATAKLTVNSPNGVVDTGNITVDFNGFLETVNYGQYSTPASMAAALGAMFTHDYNAFGLYAKAGANGPLVDPNVVTFQLTNGQTFGSLNVAGPTTSFSVSPTSGFTAATTSVDTGTVTLTVNGAQIASINYADGATPTSIAAELARAVISTSPVKVTADGANLYVQASGTGSSTNYSYAVTVQDTAGLTPSFQLSPTSGTLRGGADANQSASPVTVYSYSIWNPANNQSGYDPTGNVLNLNDSVMGNWTYGYDSLNRLVTGLAANGQYAGQSTCWSYDSFGNRTFQSVSTTPCGSSPTPTLSAQYNANNQISSSSAPSAVTYDGAGDVLTDGSNNSYVYDAEGRICAVHGPMGMIGYQYDADGNRVSKGSISVMSCDVTTNGYQPTNNYVLDQNGGQMTELAVDENGTNTWQHSNVTANGTLIATYDLTGLHFYLNDPLGTRRAQTDAAGVPEQTCLSLPFGDQLNCAISTNAPTEHHFTGKERDQESGLDYFGARYLSSTMGRFMSPDDGSDQNALNPQSWNLYSYGRNNPLIGTDDDGRTYNVCDENGQNCSNIDDKTFEAEQQKDQANGVNYSNGSITDSTGAKQGTYSHDPDIAGDPASNIAAMGNIGNQGMGAIKFFGEQMALNVAGGVAAHGVGLGVEAVLAARATRLAAAAEAAVDAEKIANGHAFVKHAGEFGNVTQNEFKSLVQETIANPSDARSLSNGRTAYWSDSQQMVVIKNPGALDGGTAFRPTAGKAYFDNLR